MSDAAEFEEDGVTFSLVMPFVVCTSKGGPYDDNAFAAGWHCGQIDTMLAAGDSPACTGEPPLSVRTESLPQLDLIAMRHGYVMRTEEWIDDPYWTLVTFDPVEVTS